MHEVHCFLLLSNLARFIQGWEIAHQISSRITCLLPKKVSKWAICSLMVAHLSWATWAIRSLRSEEMSETFFFSPKNCNNIQKIQFFQFLKANCSFFVSEKKNEQSAQKNRAICSFVLSNLSKLHTSLICHERPERFINSCSFVLRDLSESLKFAHLSWAIWVNKRWANERIPNPGFIKLKKTLHKVIVYKFLKLDLDPSIEKLLDPDPICKKWMRIYSPGPKTHFSIEALSKMLNFDVNYLSLVYTVYSMYILT